MNNPNVIVQGTPEWFAARRGKVTASRVADLMARTKSGFAASRANYKAELVLEILTGNTAVGFTSEAMKWGTEQEPNARAAYAATVFDTVTEVGFVDHPDILGAGCSPDGLVGDDGIIEIKCPNSATHLDTLMGGGLPEKYHTQIMWQMACTGRKWCDFVSFDPRMPERLQLFIHRVERDDAKIQMLETEVRKFLAELDDKLTKISKLGDK